MNAPTLVVKEVSTTPIRVAFDLKTDAGQIKGHVVGHAKIRSKAENQEFAKRVEDGEFSTDLDMLREMYDTIDGLGDKSGAIEGDAVWDFLLKNKVGSFLVPGLIDAYFEQYAKARVGNFGASQRR